MKTHSLEFDLNKSTNSIRVAAFAIIGTAILFCAMSISRLGEIDPTEEIEISKLDVFLPPPPPPPPPEEVIQEEAMQVPIQVDVTINPEPTKLTVRPVETNFDAPSQIVDRIEVSLTEFQRPTVDVDLDSIVYEKSEVDRIPVRSHTPIPHLPAKIKKKVGAARIIVQLSIDDRGKPLHVMVLNPPVAEARAPIISALKRWRFRPAEKNGRKVKCWVRFTLVYQESNSSPFSL